MTWREAVDLAVLACCGLACLCWALAYLINDGDEKETSR